MIGNDSLGDCVFEQTVKKLTDIFHAPCACLYAKGRGEDEARLIAGYNVPTIMQPGTDEFNIVRECQEGLQSVEPETLKEILYHKIPHTSQQETKTITDLISIPLNREEGLIGLLNLGYSEQPQLSQHEENLLAKTGKELAVLLDLCYLRGAKETHVARTAFLGFITRIISQETNLQKLLSITLEHTIPLLNASKGGIYLSSHDGHWLELASSLTPSLKQQIPGRVAKGQGLIGWVADQGRMLYSDNPYVHPYFDSQVDQIDGKTEYSLLAVPMRHHEEIIGVLAVYGNPGKIFSEQDAVMLESIASLAASGIADAHRAHSATGRALRNSVAATHGQRGGSVRAR